MKRFLLYLCALLPILASAQTVQFKSSNVAITGGTVQGITTLGARSSGAAFDLQIGSSEVLTANRLLKFSLSDAARTITVPGTTTLPIISQALTISGPTAARTITVPDAAFTVARTDAANTFTGHQTIEGVTSTGATGTGNFVFDASPTLVTPTIGVATATSVNKVTITAPATSAILTIANGKTLAVNNTLTFAGTDGVLVTLPTTSATMARTDAAQSLTGTQTILGNVTIGSASTGRQLDMLSAGATLNITPDNTSGANGVTYQTSFAGGGNGPHIFKVGSTEYARVSTSGFDATGRVGATTQYNVNGVLHVSATAPTVTGFGTSPSVPNANGTSAFTVNVGTGGTANTGSVTLPAAATGWVCTAQDVTTPASFVVAQTGGTTTTATFTNYSRTTGLITAWTASDVLRMSCFAY